MKTPEQIEAFTNDLNALVAKYGIFIEVDGWEFSEILENGEHNYLSPYTFVEFDYDTKQYKIG